MSSPKQSAWHEHRHTAQVVTGAVMAIVNGFSNSNPQIASLGLQTVLELVYERMQRQQVEVAAAAESESATATAKIELAAGF